MKSLIAITIAATYGISLRLLFVSFGDAMAVMSVAFFFVVPFLIGYLTIFLIPYRESHTGSGAFFKPWATCAVILIVTCIVKLEGMICWVMAYPIFAIIAGFGGYVAFNRKRRRFKKKLEWDFEEGKLEKPNTLKISLLFFIPLFAGLLEGHRTTSPVDLSIEKHLDLPASPDAVWSALTTPRQNTTASHHLSLCNIMGFPRHKSTTLDTLAVGKQRIAAYEKGLTFVETISRIEPARSLEVSITTDPAQISKAIMDEHIVIGGEHIQMQGDTYTLQPLPGGKTRLSLVSHFSINTPFNWYARIWANWLMSDVLQEELQSLNANLIGTKNAGLIKNS
ncbi:MAG: hypothetical protein JST68_22085 [Bacteroidetes bacterium]|nr:hypothetical protein [Bacteroidota bacterium]